jgi:hypothetical protein
VVVPLQVELARTEGIALTVSAVVTHTTGFVLALTLRQRVRPNLRLNRPTALSFHTQQADDLRFGLHFSDGAKATTTKRPRPGETREPSAPLLMLRGARGGGHTTDAELWVWPLPPPGLLAFACEWRAEGIPLTRREIDARPILEAAAQVEQLWPDERPLPTGPWTHHAG